MAEKYTKDTLSKWFESKAMSVSAGAARNTIFGVNVRKRDFGVTGNLYFFRYEAKGKEILPMWDKYPLAVILERKPDGFLGLNLHYLSGSQRSSLLGLVDKYKEEYKMKMSVTTGTSVNWINLMQYADMVGMESLPPRALKRYLFTQCRSKFIEIYPDEYDKAIQLPIEQWVIKR
jgi:hypothetical protein